MAPSRSIELRGPYALARKIPYGRVLRRTTVVELPRKHLSMARRGKEMNKVLA